LSVFEININFKCVSVPPIINKMKALRETFNDFEDHDYAKVNLIQLI